MEIGWHTIMEIEWHSIQEITWHKIVEIRHPDRVDRFITEATRHGLHRVRIMTGKGKGIVQKEVMAYLKLGKFSWNFETNAKKEKNEGVLVVQI